MSSFLQPLRTGSPAGHRLENTRNGSIVASELMVAFDSASRNKGLLHRDSMPAESAMIIAPTNAIHTFFMRFAIDVAFVSKEGRVLKQWTALRAWRIAAAWGAHAVIELPAGSLDRSDTKPGDRLIVV